jgi:hypothetical protein
MRTEFCALSILTTAVTVANAAVAPSTLKSAGPLHIPIVRRRSVSAGTPEEFGAVADRVRTKYGWKPSLSGMRKRAGNTASVTIINQVSSHARLVPIEVLTLVTCRGAIQVT